MNCYHTTDAADAILREGFRDTTRSYMFAEFELTGVWLGDSPMDIKEGATGDQVLRVEFPEGVDLGNFEIIEEHNALPRMVRAGRTDQRKRHRCADDRRRGGRREDTALAQARSLD
jgi:hypothetical protein